MIGYRNAGFAIELILKFQLTEAQAFNGVPPEISEDAYYAVARRHKLKCDPRSGDYHLTVAMVEEALAWDAAGGDTTMAKTKRQQGNTLIRKAFVFDEQGNVRADLSDEAVLAVAARHKLKRDGGGYHFNKTMEEEAEALDVQWGRLPSSVLKYTTPM